MKNVTIEEIDGKKYTVVWHKYGALAKGSVEHVEWLGKVILYWFGSDINGGSTHIATALPALPQKPNPEDAPLLYRYASEGFLFGTTTRLLSGAGIICWLGGGGSCEIVHMTDKEGNRVEVAIKD